MIEIGWDFVTGMAVGADYQNHEDEEIAWLLSIYLFIIKIYVVKIKEE